MRLLQTLQRSHAATVVRVMVNAVLVVVLLLLLPTVVSLYILSSFFTFTPILFVIIIELFFLVALPVHGRHDVLPAIALNRKMVLLLLLSHSWSNVGMVV